MADLRAGELLDALPRSVDVAAIHHHDETWVLADPSEVRVADGAAAFTCLDELGPGFWVTILAFELGHAVERVVSHDASREQPFASDLVVARFDARARVDGTGCVAVDGDGPGRPLLERAACAIPRAPGDLACDRPWASSLSRDEHEQRVEAVLGLLVAGECYQVNLTRRLEAAVQLDAVTLYRRLVDASPAPHASLVRLMVGGRPFATVSASPERFLSWAGRHVETRPIKGTGSGAAELAASAKDRAENVMIVDLARNDLGRVCVPGSVRVPALCEIEAHPGLYHLVSTVRGELRADVGLGALLRATFPPASVTGAPKPRVLQAIEDLEPVRRGVYCGAVGWIDTALGEGDLSVAIRTFVLTADRAMLGVGGGIVADSTPDAEWDETELKGARLLAATGSPALLATR